MSPPDSPRVLCVDDEARVLEGVVLHLRKDYAVHTALSGQAALKVPAADRRRRGRHLGHAHAPAWMARRSSIR